MRHYFLGTAAGISKKERILRRKMTAEREDYEKLTDFLSQYHSGEVRLTRNGRSAIALGLKYSGIEIGEVIINGFTCRAVVQGVKEAGFTPVYADISRENLNFSVSDLEKVLSDKTRAVIVQNTLGNMAKIQEIEEFCKKHNLILIEDLAHSFGLKYSDEREAGMVGKIVILSFGKEKMLDAGNGGAVIFRGFSPKNLPELKKEPPKREEKLSRIYPTIGFFYRISSYIRLEGVFMRLMLKFGLVVKSAEGEVDLESHLGYFQAKLALKKLKDFRVNGRVLREFYLVNEREKCLKELVRAGYYFGGFWYEKPVAPERYYEKANFPEEKCKNAVFISEHIINFPTYYTKNELKKAREIVERYIIK